MTPEDNDPFKAAMAGQLAGLSEEERVRTKYILELAFENLVGFEERVRRLEKMPEQEAGGN